MSFVYFGSSEFSCVILEDIILRQPIPSLIITQPDQKKGRGLKILPTPISIFAANKSIPLIKPSDLNSPKVREKLKNQRADFFIVADYGKKLPKGLLSLPKKLTLGLHPSLLPQYRGAAPIDWALINGDAETGVTAFKVNERFDSGEIILQKRISVDYEDDIFSLSKKLAKEGTNLLIEAIEKINTGDYTLSPQDESRASSAPKLTKNDGRIQWIQPAEQIRNLIRATLGWPSAYTHYKEKLIKILGAEVVDIKVERAPSTIVRLDHEGIYVATPKGVLKIKRLKPEGKKEMDAWSFVCGYRIKEGDKFS